MKDPDAIVFVVNDDPSIREAINSLVSLEGLHYSVSWPRMASNFRLFS
jgi:hypothetical protein